MLVEDAAVCLLFLLRLDQASFISCSKFCQLGRYWGVPGLPLVELWVPPWAEVPQLLWDPVPVSDHSHGDGEESSYLLGSFLLAAFASFIVCLCLLYTLPFGSCRQQQVFAFSSTGRVNPVLLVSPWMSTRSLQWHLLASAQCVCVFLVTGSPELGTALEMRPHKSRSERKDHLAQRAGCTEGRTADLRSTFILHDSPDHLLRDCFVATILVTQEQDSDSFVLRLLSTPSSSLSGSP